ncbi:VapE domain-containing protein [Gluconobacter sp. OJB]|uniref:VapE domain-containing protein n=1 Tax=Gluconobacter sp. OJB TaxID=3145196 RepID=UPI0031F7AD5B
MNKQTNDFKTELSNHTNAIRNVIGSIPKKDIIRMALQHENSDVVSETLDILRSELKFSSSDITAIKQSERMNDEFGSNPTTSQDFIRLYSSRINLGVTAGGRTYSTLIEDNTGENDSNDLSSKFLKMKENSKTKLDASRQMFLATEDYGLNFNSEKFHIAFDMFYEQKQRDSQFSLIQSFETPKSKAPYYDVIKYDVWNEIYEAAFNTHDNDKELVIAVLKKFIHSVKRKLGGLQPQIPLMPILVGPQNKGKSTFIEKFISPLEDWYITASVSTITDERNIGTFSYPVVVIDEMKASISKAVDWEAFKEVVTLPIVGRRPMRSNDIIPVVNMTSLIGSTNKSFEQVIVDDTGNRRFYPFHISSNVDYERLNKALEHIQKIWMSVDENEDSPLVPLKTRLNEEQQKLRTQSDVEQWFVEEDIDSQIANKSDRKINVNDLFKLFKEWSDLNAPFNYFVGKKSLMIGELKKLHSNNFIESYVEYDKVSKKTFLKQKKTIQHHHLI